MWLVYCFLGVEGVGCNVGFIGFLMVDLMGKFVCWILCVVFFIILEECMIMDELLEIVDMDIVFILLLWLKFSCIV